ncbi:hypothetical protein P4679_25060 [Priestia megaterium]|uniref:hypothetical protein n=1 Tax=Priestia megaterium TaxID=1404 RepID=UPI002E233E0D|nr:hypothetical protein [Priestia megaterium]
MNTIRKDRFDADTTAKLVLELRDKGLSEEQMLDLKARCEKLIEHINWSLSPKEGMREMSLEFKEDGRY